MEPLTKELTETLSRFVVLYVAPEDRERALVTLVEICAAEYLRGAADVAELVRIGHDVLSAPAGSEDGQLARDALRGKLVALRGGR
jgi:hypothetical protein